MRRGILFVVVLVLIAQGIPTHASAEDRPAPGACAQLTVHVPQSASCDAEIAANPLPTLERPVTYERLRDGQANPRSFLFPEQPLRYPVGWQRRAWYFSDAPGVYPADNDYTNARRIPRETMYFVYASVEAGGEVWHLIGVGQWMRAEFVSVLQIPTRPEGVSGQWIALDLRQQTLVAMVDDQPVFATLMCSGYYLITEPGLFHIYARTESMIMRGPPGANPPLYEFYTKWVLFFNEHQGMHAMPYHNNFGMKRTHGCVNVPPGDEQWLWNWVAETESAWNPSGAENFFIENPDAAPWVYVYESAVIPTWGEE